MPLAGSRGAEWGVTASARVAAHVTENAWPPSRRAPVEARVQARFEADASGVSIRPDARCDNLDADLWPGKTPGHTKINYEYAFRPKGFYRSTFKPACDAVGLGGLVFHELRHTFATLALESGLLTMYELSVAMGHESEAVTNKIYAHIRKRDHTARRAAFSAFLAESAAPPAPLRQIGG